MSKRLSGDEREAFREKGILFPISAVDPSEMAGHYRSLQSLENDRAGRLPPLLNFKPHLLVPWLWDMTRDTRIVDPVEDILGGDILCWEASFFSKSPGATAHVTWHQDATYWGLSENIGVTAWVAFTQSVRENGCMRVLPGSHLSQLPHVETPDRRNMLPAREEVVAPIEASHTIDVILQPGEMSLHHPLLIHGSEPNNSQERRVGFAIRYISGRVRQRGGERGSATLVRGKDHGHFDLEQAPEGEFHPAARARHAILLRRWMKIVRAEVDASG